MTYDTQGPVVPERRVPPETVVNTNDPAYGQPTLVARGPGPLTVARRALDTIFGIIEILLLLRVLLLALGANSGNALVDGIYSITEPLVAPFIGVFNINHVHPTGNSTIDVAALVAVVGWALIGLLVDAIFRIADRRPYAP
ncbi:MAG TPA: YggT family protein [Candidatus Limnocylindria bacterium]|nr:YggT family protein [Candidatus Limnocylindria bacterium]